MCLIVSSEQKRKHSWNRNGKKVNWINEKGCILLSAQMGRVMTMTTMISLAFGCQFLLDCKMGRVMTMTTVITLAFSHSAASFYRRQSNISYIEADHQDGCNRQCTLIKGAGEGEKVDCSLEGLHIFM